MSDSKSIEELQDKIDEVLKEFAAIIAILVRNPDVNEGEVVDPTTSIMQLFDQELAKQAEKIKKSDEYWEKYNDDLVARRVEEAEKQGWTRLVSVLKIVSEADDSRSSAEHWKKQSEAELATLNNQTTKPTTNGDLVKGSK